MSILIKGMEMPPKGQGRLCIYDDGIVIWLDLDNEKRIEYKAVPVPPHGRLIDADGEIGVNVLMQVSGKCKVDLIAPTIIEAEECE